MIADTTIKRPALRYYDGKWNLGPWIISHFPPHVNYLESFGGAASVLIQKPRSRLETYNDLNHDVFNFFRALRECPDKLIESIKLTPFAREEYELCRLLSDDPIESSRRFYCRSYLSIDPATNGYRSGLRFLKDGSSGSPPSDIQGFFRADYLYKIAERFQGVQIECRDAIEVIEKYDSIDTLHYVDFPYVQSTRERPNRYATDIQDDYHIRAAKVLHECSGFVIISGYACQLYVELYEARDWRRIDIESKTNGNGINIESLWLSPRTVEALNMPTQASLL